MKTLNTPASKRLSQQTLELSIAAPQVVAQRVARMAMAGPNPSARDQKEFKQMSDEKVAAFYQSWSAIWSQMFKSQLAIAQTMTSAVTLSMLSGKRPSMATTFQAIASETSKVMSAGMNPVHRKAVSNAKRLSRG
jgi:hypothetical protein